jgi:hypothetical protein
VYLASAKPPAMQALPSAKSVSTWFCDRQILSASSLRSSAERQPPIIAPPLQL